MVTYQVLHYSVHRASGYNIPIAVIVRDGDVWLGVAVAPESMARLLAPAHADTYLGVRSFIADALREDADILSLRPNVFADDRRRNLPFPDPVGWAQRLLERADERARSATPEGAP